MITTSAVLPSVEAALVFPMQHVITRYQKREGVSLEAATLHEREIKRYLFLCAKYPNERWPMVKAIDELWHTFIIFTKDYQAFCTKLGVLFIHHQPFAGTENRIELREAYQRFLNCYRTEFGEPPPTVWPASINGADGLSECSDGDSCQSSCSQCR